MSIMQTVRVEMEFVGLVVAGIDDHQTAGGEIEHRNLAAERKRRARSRQHIDMRRDASSAGGWLKGDVHQRAAHQIADSASARGKLLLPYADNRRIHRNGKMHRLV